jgi:prepilin-type N-terminal cleavage/methylation domain-containing protein
MRISKIHSQKGFTLIEMSIVLVIIGLIVGGVLVGQELIRSATLKTVITDEQKYVTAVNTFRTKYNELPGDMVDATTYWGTDPNGCPQNVSYTAPQTTTCNGNGNGLIEDAQIPGISLTMFEDFRAWQQLSDAGLVAGSFTGTSGPSELSDTVPGLNVPSSKIANAGFEWTVFASGSGIPATFWNAQYSSQYLLFGSSVNSGGGYDSGGNILDHGVLSPTDAQAIDLKIDDGLPFSGNVLGSGYAGGISNCAPYATNAYNTSISTIQCSLLFQVRSW